MKEKKRTGRQRTNGAQGRGGRAAAMKAIGPARGRTGKASGHASARLKHIYKSCPAVIYACEPGGDYAATFISEKVKDQLGYECHQFTTDRRFWLKNIHPGDRPYIVRQLSRVLETDHNVHEYRFRHADGAWRWMRDEMTLVRNVKGDPEEIVGYWQDITPRKRLERSVAKITEEERERLRCDLHDGVAQQLMGLRLLAASLSRELSATHPEAADRAAHIEQIAGGALASVRHINRGLSPLSEEPDALVAALRELASRVDGLNGIQCRFTSRTPVMIQDSDIATHLYLIAQEAVSNAVRHAEPGRIGISLSERNNTVRLAVRDDGAGVSRKKQHKGMGMQIMQTRSALIGASFDVQAERDTGTVVTCSWKKTAPKG